ncbi:MAG: DUF2214 family protein [Devosia sp.]
MTVDLILAIAHHLAVFTIAGLLVGEVVLLRPGIGGERLRQLGAIDAAYGVMAVLIIIIGVLRVIFGDKGAAYYLQNWAFWAKMVAFLLVGLLSAPPTIAILGWRRKLNADPAFTPDPAQVTRLRRFFSARSSPSPSSRLLPPRWRAVTATSADAGDAHAAPRLIR